MSLPREHARQFRAPTGKVRTLVVGLYGDQSSERNAQIKLRAKALASRRPEKRPLDLMFFDADSAQVWR
jgi:hypothetical protein